MSIIDHPTPRSQHEPVLPHPQDLDAASLADAALLYARQNLRILPLQPGRKQPLGALVPHGLRDASADIATVQRWWRAEPEANIGLCTGEGAFDVLDVDVREGGSGLPFIQELLGKALLPRPGYVVVTPSGGRHLYYRGSVAKCSGLRGAHVDYKARGGYVVAPPSILSLDDGVGRYQEMVAVRSGEQPEVLPWQRVVDEHHGRNTAVASAPARRPSINGHVAHGLPALVRHVRRLRPGNRNSGLHWAFCRALESGLPVVPLAEAAVHTGLSRAEIARTLRSAEGTVPGDG